MIFAPMNDASFLFLLNGSFMQLYELSTCRLAYWNIQDPVFSLVCFMKSLFIYLGWHWFTWCSLNLHVISNLLQLTYIIYNNNNQTFYHNCCQYVVWSHIAIADDAIVLGGPVRPTKLEPAPGVQLPAGLRCHQPVHQAVHQEILHGGNQVTLSSKSFQLIVPLNPILGREWGSWA